MKLKVLFLQLDYELDKQHITLKECLPTLNEYDSLDYLDFINEKNREREKHLNNIEANQPTITNTITNTTALINDNYIKNDYYTKIKLDEIDFYKPRNFDAYLIIWNSNKFSTIHNHAERGCIFKILTGSLIETRYQKDTLNELGTSLLYSGSSSYIDNNQGLHKVGSDDKNNLTISLHIYAPKNYIPEHYDIIENIVETQNENKIVNQNVNQNTSFYA
jgi:hypothetical protein